LLILADAICNPTLSSTPVPIAHLNYNPGRDAWPVGPYSFFTMQMIPGAPEEHIPELTIEVYKTSYNMIKGD
jgi:hypothetical protein